jgi:hypothetical protein
LVQAIQEDVSHGLYDFKKGANGIRTAGFPNCTSTVAIRNDRFTSTAVVRFAQ